MNKYLISVLMFLKFIFWPLIKGIRSAWLVLLLIFIYPGYTLTFLEIPTKEQAVVVDGEFIDTTIEYSRNGKYSTKVRTSDGAIYACVCYANSSTKNCLSENSEENKIISKNLSGKSVKLLLYPSGSVYGGGNLCYQLSMNGKTWFTYEKYAAIYAEEKRDVIVYVFWFFVFLFIVFVCVRIYQFKGKNNVESRC